MRKTKKAVACLVAMLMVLSTFPLAFTASAAQSGVCGDDLTWTLENGVFTVSGYGEMYDNGFPSLDSLMDPMLTTIVIEPGVTHIGAGAFRNWPATEVSIPQTVTSIGSEAFAYSGLTSVTVPGSVQSWPQAFGYCQQLRTVRIEPDVTKIDDRSFWWCENLQTVEISPSSTLTSIEAGAFIGCSSLTSFRNDGIINDGFV
ncbi:MAG: leucine-rich repeat domain-containing protein, partial [Clostridia bacterium]|nr:leucine-rich repeat domain-containing protein [Clostridia bacterium]